MGKVGSHQSELGVSFLKEIASSFQNFLQKLEVNELGKFRIPLSGQLPQWWCELENLAGFIFLRLFFRGSQSK